MQLEFCLSPDYRQREYLTEAEVARLVDIAGNVATLSVTGS
jgi:hypothetical protein